jgi:amino-acid N-acetyltransferase
VTETVTVRPAEAADAVAVDQLVAAATLPTGGLEEAWLTLVSDDPYGVAGTATLERYAGADGPVFLLRSVAVRTDRRGTGLGSALVRAALEAADREAGGHAVVGLLTDNAAGYYDRFGFDEVVRTALPQALLASPELSTLCPASARAFLRG